MGPAKWFGKQLYREASYPYRMASVEELFWGGEKRKVNGV